MPNHGDRPVAGGATSRGIGGEDREGPFWDIIAGRGPSPPPATLLGWELEAVDPDAGTSAPRP